MNPDGGFEEDDLLRICGFAKAYQAFFSIQNVYQNLSRPFTTSFRRIQVQKQTCPTRLVVLRLNSTAFDE